MTKERRIAFHAASLLATALLTTLASAQNVGIGTTTPKSKLSVNGSTASGGLAIGDATYTSTTGTVAPLNGAIIQGFTGIGTSAPGQLLHVLDGNILRSNSSGTASTLITTDGSIELFRQGPSLPVPFINGYIDFKDNAGDDLDARIFYYKGVAGQTPPLDTGDGLAFVAHGSITTPQMLLEKSSGNLGIGTVAPLSQLDVRGTTKIMATTGTPTGNFWNGTSNVNGFEVTTGVGGDVFVGIQRAGALAPLHLAKPAGAAVGDPFELFIVNAANVGTITRTAGGVAFNTTSDERLKENIRPSAKGLKDVMKIQVSDYNYKSAPGRDETGFIAQQLNTILPDAVTPGGDDPTEKPWAVDYGRVTPLLAKAIQEQQGEIASLNSKVATLEAENARLREQADKVTALGAKMEALEKLMAVKSEDEPSDTTMAAH